MKTKLTSNSGEDNATITKKFRLRPADAAKIEERAARSGLTSSEYIRRCALGRRIDVQYDADAVLALTRIADSVDALRELLRDHPGSTLNEEVFRAFVNECIETMQRTV